MLLCLLSLSTAGLQLISVHCRADYLFRQILKGRSGAFRDSLFMAVTQSMCPKPSKNSNHVWPISLQRISSKIVNIRPTDSTTEPGLIWSKDEWWYSANHELWFLVRTSRTGRLFVRTGCHHLWLAYERRSPRFRMDQWRHLYIWGLRLLITFLLLK